LLVPGFAHICANSYATRCCVMNQRAVVILIAKPLKRLWLYRRRVSSPVTRRSGPSWCLSSGTNSLSKNVTLLTLLAKLQSSLTSMSGVVLNLQRNYVRSKPSNCRFLLGGEMSIYEAIGTAWVIFTSAIATVEILYLAFVGLKTVTTNKQQELRDADVP